MSNAENKGVIADLAPYISLGVQLFASVVLAGALGWWLDNVFDASPVLFVVMLCVGCVSGLTYFLRIALTTPSQNDESRRHNEQR